MSMRDSSHKLTICEILRQINDIAQDKTDKDKQIRKLLSQAESMAKRMSYKMLEHNQEIFKDWWADNPDHLKLIKKRLNKKYISGE